MFGFFPEDGAGDCALVLPGVVRTQISAALSAARIGFVFVEFVCFPASYFAAFGKIMFRSFF
jgi:hypothetical protein